VTTTLFVTCGTRDVYTGELPEDSALYRVVNAHCDMLRLNVDAFDVLTLKRIGVVGIDHSKGSETRHVFRVVFIGDHPIVNAVTDAERTQVDATLEAHGLTRSPGPVSDHYWLEGLT